jgi:hypothetical protein
MSVRKWVTTHETMKRQDHRSDPQPLCQDLSPLVLDLPPPVRDVLDPVEGTGWERMCHWKGTPRRGRGITGRRPQRERDIAYREPHEGRGATRSRPHNVRDCRCHARTPPRPHAPLGQVVSAYQCARHPSTSVSKKHYYNIYNRDGQKGFTEAVFATASDQRSRLM